MHIHPHNTAFDHTPPHDNALRTGAMDIRAWFEGRLLEGGVGGQLHNSFYCSRATPRMMDACWADGWRHFGTYFFRSLIDLLHDEPVLVLPLRVRVADVMLSKSQRRIWRKNADVNIEIRPIQLTEAHTNLFENHKRRFRENTPETLQTFLSPTPASVPCLAHECRITERDSKRLMAVSFVDVGEESLSSVYAMFAPEESARSLGIYTLLCELDYAKRLGKKYLYLGYAYNVPSFYDYKKNFSALEYYDWRGEWLPLAAVTDDMPSLSIKYLNV
jgi:arginine-tRNA-protein transferase